MIGWFSAAVIGAFRSYLLRRVVSLAVHCRRVRSYANRLFDPACVPVNFTSFQSGLCPVLLELTSRKTTNCYIKEIKNNGKAIRDSLELADSFQCSFFFYWT